MTKRLSRDVFPQKVRLFLIFCLWEGILEDLKIWHILFRQGPGKSHDRAGRRWEAQGPSPPSWASGTGGQEAAPSTAAGISSQRSPAELASCPWVKWNSFPLLNKLLSHYYLNVSSIKCFLKQTNLLGIYEGHHPAPMTFTSCPVCRFQIKMSILFWTEINTVVALWRPQAVSTGLTVC